MSCRGLTCAASKLFAAAGRKQIIIFTHMYESMYVSFSMHVKQKGTEQSDAENKLAETIALSSNFERHCAHAVPRHARAAPRQARAGIWSGLEGGIERPFRHPGDSSSHFKRPCSSEAYHLPFVGVRRVWPVVLLLR